jgi:hypothetical protein
MAHTLSIPANVGGQNSTEHGVVVNFQTEFAEHHTEVETIEVGSSGPRMVMPHTYRKALRSASATGRGGVLAVTAVVAIVIVF